MLGKLLKYDFRSILKSFIPLWLAFVAISIINRFTFRFDMYEFSPNVVGSITMFVYVCLMMAINVIGLVLIIQRFYNGLLKDEGYLMFTLPVTPTQLIVSKGLSASAIILVNSIVSVLSVFILIWNSDFLEGLRVLMSRISLEGFNVGLIVFLAIVLLLVSVLQSIFQIYASMALGHLASKHRVGFSVGAYLGISVVLSIISSVITWIYVKTEPMWLINWAEGLSPNGVVIAILIFFTVITLILLAAFFMITRHILSKKLNLE